MCANILFRIMIIALQGWLIACPNGDDDTAANRAKDGVRVLCWVMTTPWYLEAKAKHVKATWGKRCNILLFMSSKTNTALPAVGLDVREGREHLTAKTMQAFKYIYEHHFNDADWFMKADDDTYVIVENLRYFLRDKNPNAPIYFGDHLKSPHISQGFYSGGAGYVISKEALARHYTRGTTSGCRQDGGAEDFHFGHCMAILGVRTASSTDAQGRSLFHLFSPETHVTGNYPAWYLTDEGGHANKGISDYPISFHYMKPAQMYAMEWYVYRLRLFGLESEPQKLDFSSTVFTVISHIYTFLG